MAGGMAATAEAQEGTDEWEAALRALETLELAHLPDGFGDDREAAAGWLAFESGRHVRARAVAEEILAQDPESITGHCLLGLVQHRAEGNLPIALYLLRRCRELFEARHGPAPGDETPWFWHALAITEMAFVSGEMGRHEDKVQHLLERDAIYEPPRPADRGWPLMRLRRYGAARQVVAEAYERGDPDQVVTAKTVLCAVEAEEQNREASYVACREAADHDRMLGYGNPTPFTNAAESALGMLEMGEAESLILEATERFVVGTVSNPWLDLTLLYVAEGRVPEALDAVRRMFRWRNRQPAYMDEQNRAETELTSAIFLIVAGHPGEAARITARALEKPDRTGFTSSESEQMEAAAALVDRLAQRTAAEVLSEEASAAPLLDGLRLRLAAANARLRAWASGRRAAALLADERILLATLRPYLAGAVEIPEWIEPELAAVLGPGVVAAALEKARARETLAGAEGYFRAYAAEIALLRGREREALEEATAALAALPENEALLTARVAALGASAARRAGQNDRAMALYDRAMQVDPGVIRRLGLTLPTRFLTTDDPLAESTLRHLRRSPRFDESPWGFQVRTVGRGGGVEACLLGAHDAVLACARAIPRAGESADDLTRRAARELHAEAFAPRLDLTQADIRTLDGSPTAGGGRASERLRSVLGELVDE